jgi:glycosyltransferase involved in cell wall biosynthesis
MRVLIDGTYARRAPHSGTAVYLDRLVDALARVDGVEVVLASNPRRRPPAGGGFGSVRNLLVDSWWTSVEMPRRARAARVDVIHWALPAYSARAGAPQVVTVHDLAFERLPQLFDGRFRAYAGRAHRAAAQRAAAVVCVSETTAADVRALWGAERVVVARHGPGQSLPAVPRGAPEHFLYVGDAEPRKDLPTLLAAYARYRAAAGDGALALVLAGSAHGDGDGVRVVGDPDARALAELHAGAAALVHPSLYEGFGLTPLEAMIAGTPVIAAAVPGVREVCGDAARYATAGDPDSFATAMGDVARDHRLRAALTAEGHARAAEFSWATSARAHVEAYSLAMGRRP